MNNIHVFLNIHIPTMTRKEYEEIIKYIDLPCKFPDSESKFYIDASYDESYKFYLNYVEVTVKNTKKEILSKFRRLLNQKKVNCKNKNIPYNLDIDWYLKKLNLGCSLTGIPFDVDNTTGKKGPYSPYQPSIDRIEPDRGYLKENCRLILFCLNLFKMQFNDSHMFKIAEKLLEKKDL